MEQFIETVRKYPCLWNTTAIEYRDQELKDAAWAEVMKETDLSSVKEVKLKWKKVRDSYRDALKRQSEMLAKDPSNQSKKNYPWKYMGHMHFLQPYMSNRKKQAETPTTSRNGHALNGAATADEPPSDSDSESEGESTPAPERPPPSRSRRCSANANANANAERLGIIERKLDYLCQERTKRRFTEAHLRERKCDATAVTATARASPIHAPVLPPDPLDIFFNGMCQSTKRFPFQTQIKIKRTLFEAVTAAEEALLAEQQSYATLWARGADVGAGAASSSASSEPDEKPT